ncbi:MAG: EAL domain-containing protein [Terracidiphilus sp.]
MIRLRANSLATNITAVVLVASCISLAVFTSAMLALDRMSSIEALDGRLATTADVIGQNSTAALNFNDKMAADEVLQALRNEPSIVSACLYDVSNTLFSEYQKEPGTSRCAARMPSSPPESRNSRAIVRPVRRRSEFVGTIWLTSDISALQARERRMLLLAALLGFIALLLGGAAGLVMQYRVSKPIHALAQAMRQITSGGSFDFRVKAGGSNELAQLAAGFNTMLGELEQRDRMTRIAEAKLFEQARTDALTGLPNRRYFAERLDQTLAQATRDHSLIGLLYIDLDGFKLVNDSLGHIVGDQLLREVATRLKPRVRLSDTMARVGGDEFTVILTSIKKSEGAATAAHALLEVLDQPFKIEGHEITIGASIGISLSVHGATQGADLLRQADSAMYAAKQGGRNRAAFFSADLSLMARERLSIENQLRGAITRQEIYLNYQPEFNAVTGRIVRFEALARWKHPHLGQVPPDKFIPIAEESGMIHLLGSYIMEQACREAVKWQLLAPFPVPVAVNVSAIEFNADFIVEQVISILRRTGLSPQLLQIELTETVMIGSFKRAAEKMEKLRSLGVSLAIDDFGTGYSCLSYLPGLPVDAIKIDRSFIKELRPGSDTIPMLRSMVDLAHSMNMRTVFEGVEDQSQLELVRELGADEVQGFLLGRPDGDPASHLRFFVSALKSAESEQTIV